MLKGLGVDMNSVNDAISESVTFWTEYGHLRFSVWKQTAYLVGPSCHWAHRIRISPGHTTD